mmetsp:Transcript_56923/g.151985  ORF Transcript_56923/g.151985 Transcript_56923/m.151985 type:complete len:229 (+) Transcript_56923:954-1640(+)
MSLLLVLQLGLHLHAQIAFHCLLLLPELGLARLNLLLVLLLLLLQLNSHVAHLLAMRVTLLLQIVSMHLGRQLRFLGHSKLLCLNLSQPEVHVFPLLLELLPDRRDLRLLFSMFLLRLTQLAFMRLSVGLELAFRSARLGGPFLLDSSSCSSSSVDLPLQILHLLASLFLLFLEADTHSLALEFQLRFFSLHPGPVLLRQPRVLIFNRPALLGVFTLQKNLHRRSRLL